MSNLVVVGIDYSMSSPAITVHTGPVWAYENCKFFFLTDKKKYLIDNGRYTSFLHKDYKQTEERFDHIANWALAQIPFCSCVYIEDYAYAAKGQVFKIGENGHALKHKLWKAGLGFELLAPTTIKKFASGKGNANKLAMHEAFLKETNINVSTILVCRPGDSPSADVIDSYYIAKLGFNRATAVCIP